MTIDTLLTTIRNTDFTSEETARIIEAMEQKGMIESASLPSSGTESQPLADFLDHPR
jgi:hypothetical protein